VSQPLIEAEHVFKEYRLQHRGQSTLKEAVLNRVRGTVGHYEPFWALRDVSISVDDGEVLGIIGPNGAGKTTLLSILAGIVQPTSGRVTIRGSCAALLGLGVGLDPQLTGRENAVLYGSVLGVPRKVMAERMDDILDFADLAEFSDAAIRTYSTGMRARLAFSVALNVTPDILLLDEVLAVGDLAFRQKCLDRMMSLRERIRGIVLIAHQMDTIREWCHSALWLQHGAVAALGPAHEVTEAYQEAMQAAAEAARMPSRGPFEDVAPTHPARYYIAAAARRGIIEEKPREPGQAARRFAPDEPVRRRDVARYLCRAAGKRPLDSPTPRFRDVPASDPDYGWIERVSDADSWRDETDPALAAPAQGEGAFEPDREVTRGEMAALVCRALARPALERSEPTFGDVPASHPHFGFVERLTDPGSWEEPPVLGAAGGRRLYQPDEPVTRVQAAVIIARAWNLLLQDEGAPGDAGGEMGEV
jgi:ABC-type polysaccharide/polyol phosphate transport system ATPase subunit